MGLSLSLTTPGTGMGYRGATIYSYRGTIPNTYTSSRSLISLIAGECDTAWTDEANQLPRKVLSPLDFRQRERRGCYHKCIPFFAGCSPGWMTINQAPCHILSPSLTLTHHLSPPPYQRSFINYIFNLPRQYLFRQSLAPLFSKCPSADPITQISTTTRHPSRQPSSSSCCLLSQL